MLRFDTFHWRHKSRDVKEYVQGCLECQKNQYHGTKKMADPTPLQVPKRRWGSVATDFIVSLPKKKNGYDAINAFV